MNECECVGVCVLLMFLRKSLYKWLGKYRDEV